MTALELAGTAVAIVFASALLLVGAGLYANDAPLFRSPGIWARLGLYLSRNVAETGSDSWLPELAPIVLVGDNESLLPVVVRMLEDLQWHEVTIDKDNARVSAVVTTPLWRFRDDLLVQLKALTHGRVEAQVRASSRIGRGDLGANANHIVKLRAAFKRQGLVAKGKE
jgi:uncharacterized protein (DUF1499 family)